MATRTVRQSGGDYSTLAAALAAANAGDVISIEGAWTVNDTTAATINDDNITIQTDADSRHNGYYNVSDEHYRLVVSGANALTVAGSYSATIDGLAIIQAGTGTSDEAIRCVPLPGDTVTIKNCLIACAFNALQQDGIYTGFNVSIGTVTVENCVIYACGRSGIHSQNGATATHSGTINVNSCTLWLNGRYGSSPNAGSVGGGIRTFVDSGGNASGFTMNVHNTIAVENDTGNTNGNVPQDYADHVQFGTGPVWNVSYSIDSDNTISTAANSGTGNLASRTATANTSPGAGDWVIFGDISSAIDLRIVDNAENDAQDAHSTATAHGLTIPATDIVGTSRPQNTDYDVGGFEIEAGGPTYTLALDAGSYAVTGQAATVVVSRTLTVDAGSYSVAGQAASLFRGFVLTTDAGGYTVTGRNATLIATRVLDAEAGSYGITGQSANLLIARSLVAEAGAYSIAGQGVDLLRGLLLAADAGSYAVAGEAAGLTATRVLALEAGGYTLTGQTVALYRSYLVAATLGEYAVVGKAATLVVARSLALDAGSYTVTGRDATLTYTPAGAYTLTVDAGSYAVTGQTATLVISRLLPTETGAYTVTGQAATLAYAPAGAYILAVDAGSYGVVGQAAGLIVARRLPVDAGAYAVTGQAASLLRGFLLTTEAGTYTLTGQAIAFLWTHVLAAAAGSYTVTGLAASLTYSGAEVPETPLDRTFAIVFEGRTFVVAAESRTYGIVAEDRTYTVQGG